MSSLSACATASYIFFDSDNHIDNDPYKILFGQGNWTCSVANFNVTFKGPLRGFDGKTIESTDKKFQIE